MAVSNHTSCGTASNERSPAPYAVQGEAQLGLSSHSPLTKLKTGENVTVKPVTTAPK